MNANPDEVFLRIAWTGVRPSNDPRSRGWTDCEASGTVIATGTATSRVAAGDRVAVYAPHGGACAETLRVSERQVLPLPPSMTFEVAAAFVHSYLTAWTAVNHSARAQAREWMLATVSNRALGAALAQIGHASGLRVIVGVEGSAARERLVADGIQRVVDWTAAPLGIACLGMTDGAGVDIAVDTVGQALGDEVVASLAAMGRIVVAGGVGPEWPRYAPADLHARSATVVMQNLAVLIDTNADLVLSAWAELCALYELGVLRPPIAARVALKDVAPLAGNGLAELEQDGRVIVEMDRAA